MKKKFLLTVLALFVFSVFAYSVSATKILNVENTQNAVAPNAAPGSDVTLYSVTGNGFDLSKIKFGNVTGKSDFSKIYAGQINNDRRDNLLTTELIDSTTGKPNLTLNTVFGNTWFTAYCLDGTKKYPATGIYSYPDFYTNLVAFNQAKASGNTAAMKTHAQRLVGYVVYAALTNSSDTNVQNMFKANEQYNNSYNLSYIGDNNEYYLMDILGHLQTVEGGTDGFKIYIDELTLNKTVTEYQTITPAMMGGTGSSKVKNISEYEYNALETPVCKSGYTFNETENKCVNDSDSTDKIDKTKCPYGEVKTGDETKCTVTMPSTSVYELSFNSMDIIFNKLKLSGNLDGYEHALWILEHTYPAMSLSDALEAAGTSLDAVKQEVKALYNLEEENVETYTENVVYGVIQYALWKSTRGVDPANATIGNVVTNDTEDTLPELNKLYQYLIDDTKDFSGYATTTYTNKITLEKPRAGKEIFKESKTSYTYGPYTARYSVLEASGMTISSTNDSSELSKIKFTNEAGDDITRLTNGQKFYVVVEKSAKIGSVKIHLEVTDAVGFNPATNRGKVYSPLFTNAQNIMTGGKIENITVELDDDLIYNPKTGVENIAVLLMVTLVAFSLGYLVLSYKNKPVELE